MAQLDTLAIVAHMATMQHDHHLDAERVCRVSLVPGLAVSSATAEALTVQQG